MARSVTEPLLRDHRKTREELGVFKAHLEEFNIAGLRSSLLRLRAMLGPHTIKEEAVLYLIGMKKLKADNRKLPELFIEHHITADRINNLVRLLYGPRYTEVAEQIRSLGMILLDEMEEHMTDEESAVFPALEKLLDDKDKDLILRRYTQVASEADDDLARTPLISLPELDPTEYLRT